MFDNCSPNTCYNTFDVEDNSDTLNWKNLATPLRIILGKSLKRTSYDIKNIELLSFYVSIFSLQDIFLHSLNVIKWGKPSK